MHRTRDVTLLMKSKTECGLRLLWRFRPLLGVFVIVVFSLGLVFFRHTKLEIGGVVFAIVMMSVSSLFYIIFGQWLFSKVLRLVPISGFETERP